MSVSVPLNFGLAVLGGLAANVGLLRLSILHPGCANV